MKAQDSARTASARTLREYGRHSADYAEWCAKRRIESVPAKAETLAAYVTDLIAQDRGTPTIRMAISAIRWLHTQHGYAGQPGVDSANRLLRDRVGSDHGRLLKTVPIDLETLCAMQAACPADLLGRRDRALLALGWAGMLHRTELADLRVEDVAVDHGGVSIAIQARGGTVRIARWAHPGLDPVADCRAYLADLIATTAATPAAPFLCSLTRRRTICLGMAGDAVNDVVKAAARRADVAGHERYSSRSLRNGGALRAHRSALPVCDVPTFAGWVSGDPVVGMY